jgi:hypothetical protein
MLKSRRKSETKGILWEECEDKEEIHKSEEEAKMRTQKMKKHVKQEENDK